MTPIIQPLIESDKSKSDQSRWFLESLIHINSALTLIVHKVRAKNGVNFNLDYGSKVGQPLKTVRRVRQLLHHHLACGREIWRLKGERGQGSIFFFASSGYHTSLVPPSGRVRRLARPRARVAHANANPIPQPSLHSYHLLELVIFHPLMVWPILPLFCGAA